MRSFMTIITPAVICMLIPEIAYSTPCLELPPPCGPPPPPPCDIPPIECPPPPCDIPPIECPPPPCDIPPIECPPPPCDIPPIECPPPPCDIPPIECPPPPCDIPPIECPPPGWDLPPIECPPPPSPPSNGEVDIRIDIDINVYLQTFTECPYVDNEVERDVYVRWIETYSQEQIKYVDCILPYLNMQRALVEEITNFQLFKEKIFAVYEVFKTKNIYSKEVDLYSQTTIFEESKSIVIEAMSCLSQQSTLYTTLQYCEQDYVLMPILIGLCRSVCLSQETYIQEYSSYTSETVCVA